MESLFNSRKGQAQLGINDIGTLAFAIILGAIILGLGATILDKIKTTQTDTSTTLANNESLTWAGNNTLITFAQSPITVGSQLVYNNGTLIAASNYTISTGGISFQNDTTLYNGSDGVQDTTSLIVTDKLNITYSYTFGSSALNTTGFGLTGMNTMAEFIPTIAIVAISAVVIGIILVFFGRRRTL